MMELVSSENKAGGAQSEPSDADPPDPRTPPHRISKFSLCLCGSHVICIGHETIQAHLHYSTTSVLFFVFFFPSEWEQESDLVWLATADYRPPDFGRSYVTFELFLDIAWRHF